MSTVVIDEGDAQTTLEVVTPPPIVVTVTSPPTLVVGPATSGGGGGGGAPSGPAGGVLSGTYPDPTINNGALTIAKTAGLQAELDLKAALSVTDALATAVGLRALDSAVLHLTGAETKAGVLTLSDPPVVPNNSFTINKTNGLQTALDAKAADAAVLHLTGAETKAGVLTLSSIPVVPNASFGVAKINATGTASSGTYLRGDGVWAAPPSATGSKIAVDPGVNSLVADHAAIIAAFAAAADGDTIEFAAGTIYRVADLTITLAAKHVTVEGNGALIFIDATATTHGLRITGTRGTIRTVNSGANAGSTSLVLSTTAHGFVNDDWFAVGSTDNHQDEGSGIGRGEYNRFASASSASATVTLAHALRDTYTTTVRAIEYTWCSGLSIYDLDVEFDPTATARLYGLHLTYCFNFQVRSGEVLGNDVARAGIHLEECMFGLIDGVYVERVADKNNGNSAITEGYGIHQTACFGVRTRGCVANRCKHGFDANTTVQGGTQPRPVTRYASWDACEAYECYSAGFSSHTGSELASWINCWAFFCGGGFAVRSDEAALHGCRVVGHRYEDAPDGNNYSYDMGLYIGQTPGTGGAAGLGLVVDDFKVDVRAKTSGRTINAIFIYDLAKGARLTGIRSQGTTGPVIGFHGTANEHVTIRDVDGDMDDGFAGQPAIAFAPRGIEVRLGQTPGTVTAGDYFDDITVEGVVVRNCSGYPIVIAGGDTTRHHKRMRFDNIASVSPDSPADATTPIIKLLNGFVDKIEVGALWGPDTTSPLLDLSGGTVTYGAMVHLRHVDRDTVRLTRLQLASTGTGASDGAFSSTTPMKQLADQSAGAADNGVLGQVDLPETWTTYDVHVVWGPTGNTSGVARWKYSYQQHVDDDGGLAATAFTAGTATSSTSSGVAATLTRETIATGLTFTRGRPVTFRVQRLSFSDAADTLAGDVGLVAVIFVKAS